MMSIWDDFKYNLTKSTRLNQIILINVSVFVVVLILHIVLNIVQGMDGNGWGYLTNALSLHTNLTYLFYASLDYPHSYFYIWVSGIYFGTCLPSIGLVIS